MRFSGKVALVTGATSGIGRATAIAFARAGACVVAAGRREVLGAETVDHIRAFGGEAVFVKADVSVEADVEAMVGHTRSVYGGLDCAFNNAGTFGLSRSPRSRRPISPESRTRTSQACSCA